MADILATAIGVLCTGLLTSLLLAGLGGTEKRLGWISFALHWLSSFALLWVMIEYYGGIGDVLTCFRFGAILSQYLTIAPEQAWPNVLLLLIGQDAEFPFYMRGIGRSTGTMNALAGILLHTVGSMWAANGLAGFFSFAGKLALYRMLREQFPSEYRMRIATAVLLLPSVIFWTSGLVKEGIAVAGIGWAAFGFARAYRARWMTLWPWLLAASGLWIVSLVKAYLLIPAVAAGSVWALWNRAQLSGRPSVLRWVGAFGLAFVAMLIVGEVFPRFSFQQIGDEIATMQELGERAGGGSYIAIGDGGSGPMSQLAWAPLGLFGVLFRPTIIEVRNLTMLLNAAETTAIALLITRSLIRTGPRAIVAAVQADRTLMMCFCFTIIAGLGVGLSTTNLGTLSRYRVPLMPFYMTLVLIADQMSSRRTQKRERSPIPPAAVTRRTGVRRSEISRQWFLQ